MPVTFPRPIAHAGIVHSAPHLVWRDLAYLPQFCHLNTPQLHCCSRPAVIRHNLTMSVTQTQNAAYYRSLHVLADYELHHSAEPPHTEELEPHPAGETSIDGNPADWDITHNRVPAYRPTNRNLDLSTRAVYQNPVERVFVSLLFGGVYTVHVSGG